MILIDALRHFDVCCLKVLEYYIHKSKVPALISCFTHGNQPSALTTEPSRRLTDQERKHPLISALPDRTKTQLTNLCSALPGAKEHNLGHATDTRMIMKKIWDFQTPPHVSPISSARILENLVESREPSAGKSYSRRQPDRSFYSFVQRPLPLYITPLLLRLRTPRRLAVEEVDGKAAREPETVEYFVIFWS